MIRQVVEDRVAELVAAFRGDPSLRARLERHAAADPGVELMTYAIPRGRWAGVGTVHRVRRTGGTSVLHVSPCGTKATCAELDRRRDPWVSDPADLAETTLASRRARRGCWRNDDPYGLVALARRQTCTTRHDGTLAQAQAEWFRQLRMGESRPSGTGADDVTREAFEVVRRREALAHVTAPLGGDARDMIALVTDEVPGPWTFAMALTVAGLVRLRNPRWVAQGLRAAPVLTHLCWASRARSPGGCPHLNALAAGAPPLDVVAALIAEVQVEAGVPVTAPSPAASRSVSGLFDSRTRPLALTCLAAFHAANPAHRSLTHAEADRVAGTLHDWIHESRVGWTFLVQAPHAVVRMTSAAVRAVDHGEPCRPPEGYRDAVESLHQSVRALVAAVGGVGCDGAATARVITTAWGRDGGVAGQVRANREWHAAADRHEVSLAAVRAEVASRLDGGVPSAAFPHVLTSPVRVGDVTVTPMTDAAAYAAEGREMGHCIASYASRARMGEIVGFSVRDVTGGASSATHEVAEGTGVLRPQQHKGRANTRPPRSHVDAVGSVIRSAMARGGAASALAEARAARTCLRSDAELVRTMTDGERARWVAAHWANACHWLPPAVAAAGPGNWVRASLAEHPVREGRGELEPPSRFERLIATVILCVTVSEGCGARMRSWFAAAFPRDR